MVASVMSRGPLLSRAVLAAAMIACLSVSCAREQAADEKRDLVVEPVPGMKYYVGGPVMKADRYGRLRLSGFNGEVSAPTTRGLLIGVKVDEAKRFDYRTWLNGRAVSQSDGFLDQEGLLWYTQRVTYDGDGRVVARQQFEYDDARLVMISELEHIDPETNEVVRRHRAELPYAPVEDDEEDEEEDAKDDAGGGASDGAGD